MNPVAKTNTPEALKLVDSPIQEALITEGKPVGKIWIAAQSPDLKVTQGVWTCTAGKFIWDYAWDEFVTVLEGEAVITPKGGKPFTLRVGDFGYFPTGLGVEWHVPQYIRKTFVLRTPESFKT
jgi:uncharacterized cupin superfamily protein